MFSAAHLHILSEVDFKHIYCVMYLSLGAFLHKVCLYRQPSINLEEHLLKCRLRYYRILSGF